MFTKVVWNNEEQYGCEYLSMLEANEKLLVHSTIIYVAVETADAHLVNYQVDLDSKWITRKVKLNVNQHVLELQSDGEGNWFNSEAEEIETLKGCIDIDISATPFSNSLPIKRLNWTCHQKENFHMVYIAVPSLEFKKVPQSYQYLREEDGLRYFLYHCYDYETTIAVDSNGLVVDYPGVFSRRF
ncbi:putative glycolipid-binding domain-containing protein [Bacillus sp. LL01]|uniref:putative glycolipid-binding domain-containing protein n=1 Tax=Bacillus sp. LL01 TaxID=1665556 RepID=UPI00069D65AB|nr:putative glycolipid-binding domain-containing protein [Bacillus sp. LL01]